MTKHQTSTGRRNFLKASALAGGGLMLSFSWLNSFASKKEIFDDANELTELNGFLKIAENGMVTIMSPNPEGGQNVKTSMPMIVAEELDAEWKNVTVEQARLNTRLYSRQFIGGSQAIRTSWKTLRMAGATARMMLCGSSRTSMESSGGRS
jgi:CO/xanthine dehydrogenase Mo-binding subunit